MSTTPKSNSQLFTKPPINSEASGTIYNSHIQATFDLTP